MDWLKARQRDLAQAAGKAAKSEGPPGAEGLALEALSQSLPGACQPRGLKVPRRYRHVYLLHQQL